MSFRRCDDDASLGSRSKANDEPSWITMSLALRLDRAAGECDEPDDDGR